MHTDELKINRVEKRININKTATQPPTKNNKIKRAMITRCFHSRMINKLDQDKLQDSQRKDKSTNPIKRNASKTTNIKKIKQ